MAKRLVPLNVHGSRQQRLTWLLGAAALAIGSGSAVGCQEDGTRPSATFDRDGGDREGPADDSKLLYAPSVYTESNGPLRDRTGVQVHNLEPRDSSRGSIDVRLHYYDESGDYLGVIERTVLAGGSTTFLTRNEVETLGGASEGTRWQGSAIIEAPADAEIAAVVNILETERTTEGDPSAPVTYNASLGDAYEAVPEPMHEVFLPVVDLRQNTTIAIQNTASTPTSITVEFIGDHGNTLAEQTTIDANAVLYLRPPQLSSQLDSASANGRPMVSARITSGHPVAVSVEGRSHETATAYTGTASGGELVPLTNFQPASEIDTWVYVQNASAGTQDLTVRYTGTDGFECAETVHGVRPYATADFGWSFAKRTYGSAHGMTRTSSCESTEVRRLVGGARLESTAGANLVAGVAIQQTRKNGAFVESAFVAQDGDVATTEVVFPLLMANNSKWFTGASVVNNGDTPANVDCELVDTDGNVRARKRFTLCPNGSEVLLQRRQFPLETDVFVGSAVCQADRGSIHGVANELLALPAGATDTKPWNAFMSYAATARSGSTASSTTPYLDEVTDALCEGSAQTMDRAWERTFGNTVVGGATSNTGAEDGWLVQSPGCWGDAQSCIDDNENALLLESIENDLAAARYWVDISTLAPYPTGAFHDAIVRGLQAAIQNNPSLTIRVLGGLVPGLGDAPGTACIEGLLDNPRCYHEKLLADLGHPASVKLFTAGFESQLGMGWNHSKIIAVDGTSSLVGGHNLQEATYGGGSLRVEDPAADVTMRLEGPASASSQRYLDQLWSFACHVDRPNWVSSDTPIWRSTAAGTSCPLTPWWLESQGNGDVSVLGVGGFGLGMDPSAWAHSDPVQEDDRATCQQTGVDYFNGDEDYDIANPDNIALRSLIGSAQSSVSIYQQDLMGACVPLLSNAWYDLELFDVLADRLAEDVKVRILLSAPGVTQGSLSFPFSNSDRLADVTDALTDRLDQRGDLGGRSARDIICQNLQLTSIQHQAGHSTWNGGNKIANHSKVVSVDDAAFFIGSKNLYPTTLQDYGFMVENDEAARTLATEYLEPAWRESAEVAIVDHVTGRCDL